MEITNGLFDSIVLQRDASGHSDAEFTGKSPCAAGSVTATAVYQGHVVDGVLRAASGTVTDGVIHGRLVGLPTGGPYEVTLRVEDKAGNSQDEMTISDVLVGDVWILGGQSNMQGCGNRPGAADPHPMVHAFYMDDQWGVAQDPVHDLSLAIDQVHTDLNGGARPGAPEGKGVGPGVAFGQEMYRLTGVPQGLIACAHGGTTMSQWDPKLKSKKGRSLYGAMLRRFKKNGAKVAGVIWYQGCSDVFPQGVRLYMDRMRALVRAMRRDFGKADLPFVAVQISRVYLRTKESEAMWNAIQDQQRRLPNLIRHCAVVPSIDLTFDDGIHLSGVDQQVLGGRLAQAMHALKDGVGKLPIEFKRARIVQNKQAGTADIEVEFANVEGELQSLGRPSGLDLLDGAGVSCVYRTELHGNTVVLHTNVSTVEALRRELHYGFGLAPYCNITDSAGRSLPVFGPVSIGKSRVCTDFARVIRVSAYQPLTDKVEKLAYPESLESLGFEPRNFPGEFCDIHPMRIPGGPKDTVAFYA